MEYLTKDPEIDFANSRSDHCSPWAAANSSALNSPLGKSIRKTIVQGLTEFDMIQPEDKVLVAVSGGKDSSILLASLLEIQRRAPFTFKIEAAILDQKQPGFSVDTFKAWVESLGVSLTVLEEDTYSIVTEKTPTGKTTCSLCSRLRRGILYNYADVNGFTKIALGHHRDDLIETLLLNLFYSGKTASMPPKLLSDDKRNVLIRPLCYVKETDLLQLANEWMFPIIPCNLCGSQENLKRAKIKDLIKSLEKDNPSLSSSIMNALGNIRPSQMMDQNLFDFSKID